MLVFSSLAVFNNPISLKYIQTQTVVPQNGQCNVVTIYDSHLDFQFTTVDDDKFLLILRY